MKISEPRLRSLLRQALKVADSGKRSAAEQLYRQITEEAPESADAWLGLAGVVSERGQKIAAYEQVLALNPDNQAAQVALAELRGESTPRIAEPVSHDDGKDDPFDQSREWLDEVTSRPQKSSAIVAVTEEAAVAPVIEDVKEHHAHDEDLDHTGELSHTVACYRHSDRETSLRCYTCGRPICSDCAVKTPVGYRCPTCIREAQEVFFNAKATDYILAAVVSLPISLLAGFLVLQLGGGFFFIFIMLFIGGAVGGLIGRVAKRAVGRRRGRYLPHVVAASIVVGVIIPALPVLLVAMLGNVGVLGALLTPGIYLFVAVGAAFYQMK
jgi:hypothetical protein